MNEASPIPHAASIATTAAVIAASNKDEYDPTTMEYEDMMYDYQQFPSIEEFNAIVNDYLQNLSSKKRDKALVDNHRYSLILQVLKDPRNTAISTAQFRFWVKKMFRLSTTDHMELVCHDDKPVATREDIYDILITAHKEAHHGGRDKTSALVRKRYSWIPKELIARFVRHCPFCISRRNGCQSTPGMLPKPYTPPYHIKKRKLNRNMYYNPSSISMAATVATSAAVAAVASNYIDTDTKTFDFYYPQQETSPKPSHSLFSGNSNNDSSSYNYFSNNSAAAAAVVAAAAIAAVNSSSYQQPPSPSSVSSEPPEVVKDEDEKIFNMTPSPTNSDSLILANF